MRTAFFIFLFLFHITSVHAQATLTPPLDIIEKAKVISIEHSTLPTKETPASQEIMVEILNGQDKGEVITFTNDYIQLEEGEVFYIRHQYDPYSDQEYWTVSDAYRLNVLLYLSILFLLTLALFGGKQGLRGLASLIGSLVLIFYVLIPGILQGYSPTLVSIGTASLIIIIGSYITHGFNKTTTSAVIGMVVTVVLTGLVSYYAIYFGKLSGFSSEENVYLNMNAKGTISMVGLLFGGIMIGLLGVLYDIAIGQAIAVEELYRAGKDLSPKEIYMRALRIGREHIGALVNTLAIAYVGVSLPLILLVSQTQSSGLLAVINSEIFATEAIRILVGSFGLILAVPITTGIATYVLAHMKGVGGSAGSHSHPH